MTSARLSAGVPELNAGFDQIRDELGVPESFSPAAMHEAETAADRDLDIAFDATALPFVTIDPEGSVDLDQALFIARQGAGYRVHYAIAHVLLFVKPGGALDIETRARALTMYSPDRKVPLHPEVLSEGAASLLPASVRPSCLWTLDLDSDGQLTGAHVQQALVRSVAKLSYVEAQSMLDTDRADDSLGLLAEVGALRIERERERGGVDLPIPDQEIEHDDGGYRLTLRQALPVEEFNAQISLLTGMAAAQMMLDAGVGVLRTMPDPAEQDVERLRRIAGSLGVSWPKGVRYSDVIRSLDPVLPEHAAFLSACRILLRGADYTPFDGQQPELSTHSAVAAPYAHVTAPLRRLVDRWGLSVCLSICADEQPEPWVRETLPEVPGWMVEGVRRANALERANVDLVESAVLQHRVGEVFDAVVLESKGDRSLLQLSDPVVFTNANFASTAGTMIRLRLGEVDLPHRRVTFTLADEAGKSGRTGESDSAGLSRPGSEA